MYEKLDKILIWSFLGLFMICFYWSPYKNFSSMLFDSFGWNSNNWCTENDWVLRIYIDEAFVWKKKLQSIGIHSFCNYSILRKGWIHRKYSSNLLKCVEWAYNDANIRYVCRAYLPPIYEVKCECRTPFVSPLGGLVCTFFVLKIWKLLWSE